MRDRKWVVVAATVALILTLGMPALADTRIERDLKLESGGKFILDTDTGSVQIVGGSGSGARVVITSDRDDFESKFDVKFEERPGEVAVKVDRKGTLNKWFGSSGKTRFVIEVPESTEVDIDTSGGSITAENLDAQVRLDTSGGAIRASRIGGALLADTSGGSITIDDVDGDVDADTSGGGISIAGVRGNVRADTSGGGITVRDVTGNIDADTSGGGIEIEEAGGQVRADSSGGPIRVSFSAGNAAGGTISTSGGGITVTIDGGANLDIDASSSGGSVTFDVPVTVKGQVSKTAVKGTLGSGGALLKMRTSGGGIKIKSR
jgi:DUF4097 and DUF4098 domain-containing protein YvlB